MKLFQKLIATPALISLASGFAVNAAEINSKDLSDYSRSNNLESLDNFKSDTLFPGDWAYDLLKDGPKAIQYMLSALNLYYAKRNHARIRNVQRQLKRLYLKYPSKTIAQGKLD